MRLTQMAFWTCCLPLFLWCWNRIAPAEHSIPLLNPSFEESPAQPGQLPIHWKNCGKSTETPPDVVKANKENLFKVYHNAALGEQFLSMVVRSNGTYECIAQELPEVLQPGKKYQLSFFAARAERFDALERKTMQMASFAHPVLLEVQGTNCDEKRLPLAAIDPVNHIHWVRYVMILEPTEEIHELQFAPYYHPDSLYEYNGHILLDAFSEIQELP